VYITWHFINFRPNIILNVEEVIENKVPNLTWVIQYIREHGIKTKKMIIYTQTLNYTLEIHKRVRKELRGSSYHGEKTSKTG
jgi:superfamily II DNA helicase RecQ